MILFARMLVEQRRRWIGFAVGVAAVALIYLPLYNSAVETDLLGAKLDALPDGLVKALDFTDVSTPEGYTQATFYGLTGMVVVLAFVVGTGAWSIAGDEEAGALELTMAHAVDRRQVLIQRAFGMVVMTVLVTGVAGALVWAVNVITELGMTASGVLGATVALAGLGLLFGSMSLLIGAVTGRRALALAVTGVLGFVAYLSNTVLADTSIGGFFEAISPFHWAYGSSPLVNGVDGVGLALLLVMALLCLIVALMAFEKRDVGV